MMDMDSQARHYFLMCFVSCKVLKMVNVYHKESLYMQYIASLEMFCTVIIKCTVILYYSTCMYVTCNRFFSLIYYTVGEKEIYTLRLSYMCVHYKT